jgi:hypothetical protein
MATTLSNGEASASWPRLSEMLLLPLNETCRTTGTVPSSMPTRRTFQLWTSIGWTCVSDLNGARLEPSLTWVAPTVMSSTSRPPSFTPPSLT